MSGTDGLPSSSLADAGRVERADGITIQRRRAEGRHPGDLDDTLGLEVPRHGPTDNRDAHDKRSATCHGAVEPPWRRGVMTMVGGDQGEDLALGGPRDDLDPQGMDDQAIRRSRLDLSASAQELPSIDALDFGTGESGSHGGPVRIGEIRSAALAAGLHDKVLGALWRREHVQHPIEDRICAAMRAGLEVHQTETMCGSMS